MLSQTGHTTYYPCQFSLYIHHLPPTLW